MGTRDIPGWHSFSGTLDERATYLYRGTCPISGASLSLARTPTVERLAREVAQESSLDESKMIGVLLVQDEDGRLGFGRAFSGQYRGLEESTSWVPPLHLPTPTVSEESTLRALSDWKLKLAELSERLQSHPYHAELAAWQEREARLRAEQKSNRLNRRKLDLPERQRQGRADSLQWRDFLRAKCSALHATEQEVARLRQALADGKAARRALSKSLQAEMHQQMSSEIACFLGCPPSKLFPHGVPTGTGDCCAPKLLAWAARHELKPLAMAEVWWDPAHSELELADGASQAAERVAGRFYPPCRERCETLMGPLLAVALRSPIKICHLDQQIIVAEKPSGLLTVPGRYHWNQDSLLSRLSQRWGELFPVHRLDLETSGLVLFARDPKSQAVLRRQFEHRTVDKLYHAQLERPLDHAEGTIEDKLSPDPDRPGCYRLDPKGQSALTEYRQSAEGHVELRPITGRSHQLRVHTALALGNPIRGDRLYGSGYRQTLQLHCALLRFCHPTTGRPTQYRSSG